MTELTSAQRRALRARAHSLRPVVLVGDQGLTATVVAEANRALDAHELIKVRVMGAEREERETLLAGVCGLTGAQPVQHIGRILVIYRENPDKPAQTAQKPAKPKAAAKAKSRSAGAPRKPLAGRPASRKPLAKKPSTRTGRSVTRGGASKRARPRG